MKYMKVKQVAEVLNVHINTVHKRLKEMRQFVGYGNVYPPSALIADDGVLRVDLEAYMDFCNRRKELCEEC